MGRSSRAESLGSGQGERKARTSPPKTAEDTPLEPAPIKREASTAYVERRRLERQSDWSYEEEARRHPTLLVRRTLRSGQRVRYYGNVVVLGDVNPGAEISAGGDIIVMGWLRGLAHAGAEGNDGAMVSAFRLNPTQLRIGQYIGRAPDGGEAVLPDVPEIAEVRDGRLVIDRWQHSVLTAAESTEV